MSWQLWRNKTLSFPPHTSPDDMAVVNYAHAKIFEPDFIFDKHSQHFLDEAGTHLPTRVRLFS